MKGSSDCGGRRAVDAAGKRPGERIEDGGDSAPPSRKKPAQMPVVETGNQAVIVFLTVCTKERKPILAKPDIHELLVDSWQKAIQWSVGRYVIMPDHVHLFCSPAIYPTEPVYAWIKFWKTLASRRWPRADEQPVWQQAGWDTQLRRGDCYSDKWEYVRNNPVREQLITSAEDWPFQGEINPLSWHEK
jgi:putative transposase